MIRGASWAGCAALWLCACSPPEAESPRAIPIVVAAGHTPAQLWVELLRDEFIPSVDAQLRAAGDVYRIRWREAYGGSVAKLGGVLEAMDFRNLGVSTAGKATLEIGVHELSLVCADSA